MGINRLGMSLALAWLMWVFSIPAWAQSGLTTEDDQIKLAGKYFDSRNYEKAMPLFSQIVSNNPENPYFNYCLGVCILKVDGDKADAVRFLTTATQSAEATKIPLNAWYYLGIALHRAYRYEEAILTLQTYQKSCGKNVWRESEGDKIIAMCRNAINSNNDLSLPRHSIINETETTRNEFHLAYKNISGVGRFLKMPAEYEHKITRGKPEGALVFLNAQGNTLVYTGVAKNSTSGMDIFWVTKDKTGKWSIPEPVSSSINTEHDEAFPVLTDNDRTLYFSSKGNKSTGGYDVFKSDFDRVTGTWSEPVPMGSPVNSPGDDFYYVPSADGRSASFSSDRESPEGKCNVYSATVIKDERSFVAINGVFYCPAGLDMSDAKVTILNKQDRSLMAQFRTAAKDGDYDLKLPVPSELIYRVKLDGFGELEAEVDLTHIQVPMIFQEIVVTRKSGKEEQVTVTNRLPETTLPLAKNTAAGTEMTSMMEPATGVPDGGSSAHPAVADAKAKTPAQADANSVKTETASSERSTGQQETAGATTTSSQLHDVPTRNSGAAQETKKDAVTRTRPDEITEQEANTDSPVQPRRNDQPLITSGSRNATLPTGQQTSRDESSAATTTSESNAAHATDKPATPVSEPTANQVKSENGQHENAKATEIRMNDAVTVRDTTENVRMLIAGNTQDQASSAAIEKPVSGTDAPLVTIASTAVEDPGNSPPAGETSLQEPLRKPETEQAQHQLPVTASAPGENIQTESAASQDQPGEARESHPASPVVQHSAIETSRQPDASGTAEEKPAGKKKSGTGKEPKSKPDEEWPMNPVTVSHPEESVQFARSVPADTVSRNVVFRVQLGVFKNRTEKELREKFVTLGFSELDFIRNEAGMLSVVSGHTPSYNDAVVLKEQVKSKGITDAFIVAFSDGKRQPVNMFVTAETTLPEEE